MTECWKSEYDWVISRPGSRAETMLVVLFDSGSQRRFSSVRITLLTSDSVASKYRNGWRIKPSSSSSSVSTQDIGNDTSLPICHVVFMADQLPVHLDTNVKVPLVYGQLVLIPTLSTRSGHRIFEFNHPLTENTESVSVSFTSSHLFSTLITRGVASDRLLGQSTVGRVVRVVPMTHRRTIPLPTDILLLIFENVGSAPAYRTWRRDLLNCALVCREWTCALDTLLFDFRSPGDQRWLGHPPEISSFASALVARPSLGLGIKYLSAGYLERHPTWNPHPDSPPRTVPAFRAQLQLQQSDLHSSQFAISFFTILRLAKNIHTLSMDSAKPLIVSPDELSDALSGLKALDTFDSKCTVTMTQLLSYIATCPALKRLSILNVLPPIAHLTQLPTPSFHLTELVLTDVPIENHELASLANASSLTLQRLILVCISHLTNIGLGVALNAVSASLKYLYIVVQSGFARAQGEELALDVTIAHMERLTFLEIVSTVASERMLERRAEAFVRCTPTMPILPEVCLHLMVGRDEDQDGLVGAVGRGWPGWKVY